MAARVILPRGILTRPGVEPLHRAPGTGRGMLPVERELMMLHGHVEQIPPPTVGQAIAAGIALAIGFVLAEGMLAEERRQVTVRVEPGLR